MYLEISKKQLLEPLKAIIGVVEQRQTLPVLANVMLNLEGNQLTLTGSDAEVEVKAQVYLNNDGLNLDNNGDITLPARKLFDICKALSEKADIQLNIEENTALLKSGRSKYKMQTLPAEDFPNSPALKNPAQFEIPQYMLQSMLNKTVFCIAKNDVRYYLTGLLLEIVNEEVFFVSTDGHRLAVASSNLDTLDEGRFIIPRKAVLELAKLLGENDKLVKVAVDEHHICFEFERDLILTSKLIDGDFPDWQSIMPDDQDKFVVAETAMVKQALQRVAILSNERYKGIRLSFSPKQLVIYSKNEQFEEAEELIDVEYDGEEFEFGVNGVYLLESLNAIATQKVELSFKDSDSACLITEPENTDCQFVIMPMRL